jgi:hypothetical protein
MKAPVVRFACLVALAASCAPFALACGASINAVYESDVRFEHCMALDQRADEKSTIQRSCWDEWVKYYTFGQTRDRVDYARRRQHELSGASDFSETFTPAALAQRAVPEPTTVFAPPPMMLDSGKGPDPSASASAKPEVITPPAEACATPCRDAWSSCKKGCSGATCEKSCEKTYKRCMKKCY